MRPFSEFDANLPAADAHRADATRLRSLATWAYLLLRPGMEFVRQRSNFIFGWQAAAAAGSSVADGVSAGAVGVAGRPPLGSWMMLPDLATPATRTVLPSHDALYGAAHVELDRLGPIVVSVPANLDDRYYSVVIMDAHFDNVAHIGPRWTGNGPSDHLLVPPGWTGTTPDGMAVIESSTVSVCLYNRMLVGFVDGDIDRVRAWQAQLRLTQLAHWSDADPALDAVPVDDLLFPDLNTTTDALAYLTIGLAHLARNPMVPQAAWLCAMARDAGFAEAAADPELSAAIEAGVDDATLMLDATLTTWPRADGWMVPDPALGLPNPKVLVSAAFQQFQIGSNDISESAYSFVDTDADGALLNGREGAVYDVTFAPGAAPPIHPSGYWSLTMYDDHSFLVDNPLDRYVTRPERPGFVVDSDGGMTITCAATRPEDVPDANWLPAPEGRFRLGLRVYYPTDAVISGAWRPPAVRRRRG